MGNAFAYLGLRSPDRVPVLCGRICDAGRRRTDRAAAGGPPEDEDGRGGPGRALGGSVSVDIL